MSDKSARWERLEALLGKALAAERSRIRSDQANLIAEFIDNREFGLAFDQLEFSLADEGLAITGAGAGAMAEAADLMGIDRTGEPGRACA